MHQEDDMLLGMTWHDLAQLGVFGRIGHLSKYAKTRQLPQILTLFAKCPPSHLPSLCQLQCQLDSICSRCAYTYVTFDILPFNHVYSVIHMYSKVVHIICSESNATIDSEKGSHLPQC